MVFRSQHFLLVGILLLQLLVFQLCHVVAQFGLAHFVGGARTEAIKVLLVTQLHLHAVQLHGGDFDFHLKVGQLGLVVKFQLFQLVAAHLLFIQHLFVVGLGTLQVQFQDGGTYIHAVATFSVHFQNAGIDGRVDNFLECRDYLAGGANADFNRAFTHLGENEVFLLHSRTHQ